MTNDPTMPRRLELVLELALPLETEVGRGHDERLTLSVFAVESLDQAEDHLIFSGQTDDGTVLDDVALCRLFNLPGIAGRTAEPAIEILGSLDEATRKRQKALQWAISERNARFFEAEVEKLEGWADDLKLGLERELKELDRQIKEARRIATTALTLEEKLAGQKQIKAVEAQRSEKRRSLFDAQDQVDKRRAVLISEIESKLIQKTDTANLFTIRWILKRMIEEI